MSQTLTNLLYHIIFSTKNRENLISNKLREELYPYIGGIIKNEKGHLLSIGGMDNHIHLLTKFSPVNTVSYMLQHIKGSSSKWIHEKHENKSFSWQRGYGAFTVSESNLFNVEKYIKNQHEHHRKLTFKEEYLKLLKKHNILFEEKYLWD
jgi:putative transposase